MLKQFRDELARFIGLVLMGFGVIAVVAAVVYGLIGNLSETGIHILATALVFAVPGAYALGLQQAKSHRAGIERGLDLKLGAKERAQQAARPTVQQPTAAARFDDLLPKVDQRAVIVARQDGDTTPIDL